MGKNFCVEHQSACLGRQPYEEIQEIYLYFLTVGSALSLEFKSLRFLEMKRNARFLHGYSLKKMLARSGVI